MMRGVEHQQHVNDGKSQAKMKTAVAAPNNNDITGENGDDDVP